MFLLQPERTLRVLGHAQDKAQRELGDAAAEDAEGVRVDHVVLDQLVEQQLADAGR